MTLIYAFLDEGGSWHGDPDATVLEPLPGAGTLTIPLGPQEQTCLFAGQRLSVLYAACDVEASETSYRLDDGESVRASWRVHELLAPAYRLRPAQAPTSFPAQPHPRPPVPGVKLEFGDPHRRYCLTAQPAQDGRMELTILVCSSDGIIHGELTGELDPRDLSDIGRLITAAAGACPTPEPLSPQPPATPAASVKAAHPGASWTTEAEQYLRDAHRAGTSLQQLSLDLGRSENSIRWKLHGLKLAPYPADLVTAQPTGTAPKQPRAYTVEEKRKAHPNAYMPWTDQDEKDLAARCAQGVLLAQLAQEFGRNEGAIASRLMKIGAVGPAADEALEFGG
ncbi:hypothetical protein ABT040_16035 [Streptomyces sp. NPDC002688]|uniref:hypothetical protein n=1 Tax=Streptomyces sp. NPDC002688 TaxID=3154423 RepID=UPI003321212C